MTKTKSIDGLADLVGVSSETAHLVAHPAI